MSEPENSPSTSQMKNPSIVLYGARNAKLEDKEIPELVDSHDVLVRIEFVGVCGSDVHFWKHGGIGKMVDPTTGIVMGHEASGTIYSIGSAVTSVKPGDRVALEPGIPCRRCLACKSGTYNLCRKMRFAAAPGPPDTPGTLSRYYRIAEDFVYRIPGSMDLKEAALVEPLSVAVHAAKIVNVEPGDTVVVMGSGTIGLLCAAVARQFGAHRVILVDVLEAKLKFATDFLDCETFRPPMGQTAGENAECLLRELNLEEESVDSKCGRVDTVIEASGAASSIETGIHILRPGGKYVQIGVGQARIEFPIVALSMKEITFRGCFRYGAGDYELAVELIKNGLIKVRELISSTMPFEAATEAWDKTARGEGIKNLIEGPRE